MPVSEANPQGYKLEDILIKICKEFLGRCAKIADDHGPEAKRVLDNKVKILSLLGDSIALAEDSTTTLDRSFGRPNRGGTPRFGNS
jgi:hypothetical protein